MCLLHCNRTADEDLEKIRKSGYANTETHLANLAADDTVEEENGLGKLWASVSAWAKHDTLCKARKYRSGRHRYYFVGHHKECNYHLRYVIPFKRDETDQSKEKWFQDKVLKAILDDEVYRTLEPTPPAIEEDEENEDEENEEVTA